MSQRALFEAPNADEAEACASESSDSYCTPPEVLEPIRVAAGGVIHLDPWTNSLALAHGWVGAKQAWTITSGRHPDVSVDPRPWPLRPGDYVHGNPPYSNPLPFVLRFILEVERSKAWGMLVLKSDSRTAWARALLRRRQPLVLWDGPINFFHKGERVKGNTFASTLYVVDGTGTDPGRRVEVLQHAFDGCAWVYR